jgi:hypothetical protein
LDSNTFVDPNGDALHYTTSGMPSWLTFNAILLTFSGTPTEYANYTITLTASDDWGASASVSFTIYTGTTYTYGPLVGTLLTD